MENVSKIRQMVGLIDLTTLSETDTNSVVSKLCRKASYKALKCAAICVYPKFVAHAKKELKALGNGKTVVATVANFPTGDNPLRDVIEEIEYCIEQGADEIDVVIPYKKLQSGDIQTVKDFVEIVKKACKNKILKIIIESGELNKEQIKQACDICIDNHVSFIKTSTGKTENGANVKDVETILNQIVLRSSNCGVKVSGGVKTYEDADSYIKLFEKYLPHHELSNLKFRIGASSLLEDLLNKTVVQP